MADDAASLRLREWVVFKERNNPVLLAPEHHPKKDKKMVVHCINFGSMNGIRVPEAVRRSGRELRFRMRMTLFDSGSASFFGSSWTSGILNVGKKRRGKKKQSRAEVAKMLERGAVTLDMGNEHAVYFCTPYTDSRFKGVLELIIVEFDSESQVAMAQYGAGWFVLDLFGTAKADATGKKRAKKVKVDMCAGTPRALVFRAASDDAEWQDDLPKVKGGSVTYTLVTHKDISKRAHLFGAHVLLGSGTPLPGTTVEEDDEADDEDLPQIDAGLPVDPARVALAEPTPVALSKLKFFLPYNLETVMVQAMTEAAERLDPDAGGFTAVIRGWRLRVGLHNGISMLSLKAKKASRPLEDAECWKTVELEESDADSEDMAEDGIALLAKKSSAAVQLKPYVLSKYMGVVLQLQALVETSEGGSKSRKKKGKKKDKKRDRSHSKDEWVNLAVGIAFPEDNGEVKLKQSKKSKTFTRRTNEVRLYPPQPGLFFGLGTVRSYTSWNENKSEDTGIYCGFKLSEGEAGEEEEEDDSEEEESEEEEEEEEEEDDSDVSDLEDMVKKKSKKKSAKKKAKKKKPDSSEEEEEESEEEEEEEEESSEEEEVVVRKKATPKKTKRQQAAARSGRRNAKKKGKKSASKVSRKLSFDDDDNINSDTADKAIKKALRLERRRAKKKAGRNPREAGVGDASLLVQSLRLKLHGAAERLSGQAVTAHSLILPRRGGGRPPTSSSQQASTILPQAGDGIPVPTSSAAGRYGGSTFAPPSPARPAAARSISRGAATSLLQAGFNHVLPTASMDATLGGLTVANALRGSGGVGGDGSGRSSMLRTSLADRARASLPLARAETRATAVATSVAETLQREAVDTLKLNEVTLQFAAWKPAGDAAMGGSYAGGAGPGVLGSGNMVPAAVYFTMQFYTCRPTRTGRVLLRHDRRGRRRGRGGGGEGKRADGGEFKQSGRGDDDDNINLSDDDDADWEGGQAAGYGDEDLFLLVEEGMEGKTYDGEDDVDAPGLSLQYEVDTSTGPPDGARRFAAHMMSHTMTVEVWDANSHLMLGTATMPLAGLVRGGRAEVTTSFEVAVQAPPRAGASLPLEIVDTSGVAGGAHLGPGSLVGWLHVLGRNFGRRGRGTGGMPRPTSHAIVVAPSVLRRSSSAPSAGMGIGQAIASAAGGGDNISRHDRTVSVVRRRRPEQRVRARPLVETTSGMARLFVSEAAMMHGAGASANRADDGTVLSGQELASVISALKLDDVGMGGPAALAAAQISQRAFLDFAEGTSSSGLRAALTWAATERDSLEAAFGKADPQGLGVISAAAFSRLAWKVRARHLSKHGQGKRAAAAAAAAAKTSSSSSSSSGSRKKKKAAQRKRQYSISRAELEMLQQQFSRGYGAAGGDVMYADMLRVAGATPAMVKAVQQWLQDRTDAGGKSRGKKKPPAYVYSEAESKQAEEVATGESVRTRLAALDASSTGLLFPRELQLELRNMGLRLRGPAWEALQALLNPMGRAQGLDYNAFINLATGANEAEASARRKLRDALDHARASDWGLRGVFAEGYCRGLPRLLAALKISAISMQAQTRGSAQSARMVRRLVDLEAAARMDDDDEGGGGGGESKTSKGKARKGKGGGGGGGTFAALGNDEDLPTQLAGRQKDLRLVQQWRQRQKRLVAESVLREALTAEQHIWPSCGETVFFEFTFTNPSAAREQRFVVRFADPELRLVRSAAEWHAYRRVVDARLGPTPSSAPSRWRSAVEADMFGRGNEITLAAGETVTLPFAFMSLFGAAVADGPPRLDGPAGARTVEVTVDCPEDKRTSAILRLHVHPQPFVVHRSFHFFAPELHYLRRHLRLQRAGVGTSFVHCPNKDAMVEWGESSGPDGWQDIYLKYHTGEYPVTQTLLMLVYDDPYRASLHEVWRVNIHSLQRLDLHTTLGQQAPADLLLQPGAYSHRAQCFSTLPSEVSFKPAGRFRVVKGAVNRVQMTYCPNFVSEDEQIQIHICDSHTHRVLGGWLVNATAKMPAVTKAFDVQLALGVPASKRIGYLNQWEQPRTFFVRSSHVRVKVRSRKLQVPPRARGYIRLWFSPVSEPGVSEYLIFINDEHGQCEESLLVRAHYVG